MHITCSHKKTGVCNDKNRKQAKTNQIIKIEDKIFMRANIHFTKHMLKSLCSQWIQRLKLFCKLVISTF